MDPVTKKDLLAKLDKIDQLVIDRLGANPDPATKDTLLEIRKEQQELKNMVLSM